MPLILNCECKLCCTGQLPGDESHLWSEFLIKETVNKLGKANASGKKSKGHEFMFGLSSFTGASMFFRGSGTENALKFLHKEEFTEDEVEALQGKEHPYTDKYIVCRECEKKFGPVEVDFKEIYDKALKSFNGKENPDEYKLNDEERYKVEFFVLMSIWRLSSSSKIEWKLKDGNHQCLTELMHSVLLDESEMNYMQKYIETRSKYNCIEMIYFFDGSINSDPDNPNENFIFEYMSSNPKFIVANRLFIVISESNFDAVGSPKVFHTVIPNLTPYLKDKENSIYRLNHDQVEEINYNYGTEQLSNFGDGIIETYTLGFRAFVGRKPDAGEIQDMIQRIKPEIEATYKYGITESNIFRAMSQVMLDQTGGIAHAKPQ